MGYPFGHALKLLAHTAARRGEIEGMAWMELALGERPPSWQIPSERVKAKLVHVIPLTPAVVALLETCPRVGPYVLSPRPPKPIADWSGAVARASALSGVRGWTVHDLRRTARTGLSRLGVAPNVAERCLGHCPSGIVATYDRHSYLAEKFAALKLWSAKLDSL
jgi:integrase